MPLMTPLTLTDRRPDAGALTRLRGWAVAGITDEIRSALRRHDLMLLAAGVTFYAAMAIVPLLVVCLRGVGWLGGDSAVHRLAVVIGVFLPHSTLDDDPGTALAKAALRVPWPVLLASVLPASLYADGLRRALGRLAPPQGEGGLRRALRSRLLALAGFGFVTVALLAVAAVGSALTEGLDKGAGSLVLTGYLAFVGGWGLATLALVVTYRLGSATDQRRPALWLGAAATGSMVSGMTLGLVLLLRAPVSFGRAYGGFRTAGVLATVAGWLWLLHVVVLVGFVLTRVLDDRLTRSATAP
jgi:membrane protein